MTEEQKDLIRRNMREGLFQKFHKVKIKYGKDEIEFGNNVHNIPSGYIKINGKTQQHKMYPASVLYNLIVIFQALGADGNLEGVYFE